MRPWIKWLAGAGLAGLCITGWGCGRGGVPDPGSDSAAATDAAPEGGEAPAAAPPAVAAQAPGQAPAASKDEGQAAQDKEGAPAQAATSGEASAVKAAGNSATAEMLAIATGTQNPPGSEAAQAGGEGAPAGPTPPGGGPPSAPGAAGYSGGGSQMEQMTRMQQNQGRGGMPAGYPMGGSNQQQQAEQMARMMQQNMGARPAGSPGAPGAPGAPGGPAGMAAAMQGMAGAMQQGIGGPNADTGPADTHTPTGAVRAFLKAVRAKDRDALAEATAARAASGGPVDTIGGAARAGAGDPSALRAASDGAVESSSSRNRELFGKILDGSISDSELDDIATKLEGFQVAGENAPKTTGRLGVYADKHNERGGTIRRTFTVLREKKGWGVMDISTPTEFKGMGNFGTRKRAGR